MPIGSSKKHAVLLLLVSSTVLFLANTVIAHKSFSEEEKAAKVEAEKEAKAASTP